MCQSLQVLSQRGSQRFVATCEHATFHLRWKQTMLLIHPESFGQLLELMERRTECTLERAVRVGCMGLYFLPNGMLQLWIADTGLALQPIEAELLAELLEEAEALRHTPTSHDAAIESALNHTREYRIYEQPQIGGARLN